MTDRNIKALSREFMKLTGGCWNDYDGYGNPDLTDACAVLRVLRRIGKLDRFLDYFCVDLGRAWAKEFINNMLDQTGLMLEEAVIWLREGGRDDG